MVDFIVIIVLLVLLSAAVCYLVKAKNKGQACVGCPNASSCSKYGQCKGNGNKESTSNEHIFKMQ